MSGFAAERAQDDRAHASTTLDDVVIEPTSIAELVAFVNERLAAGRWVAAGVALIRVKREVWRIFVEEHFPMPGYERVEELIGRLDPARRSIVVQAQERPPTAMERAAAEIMAHPGLSDRAIARRIGIGRSTVQRARAVAQGGPCRGASTEAPITGDSER